MIDGVVHYYADDIVLAYRSVASRHGSCAGYVVEQKVKLNGKRSKVMVVGWKQFLKWNIDGKELEVMEAFSYLGDWINEKLRGNLHLEEIKARAEECIGKVGSLDG